MTRQVDRALERKEIKAARAKMRARLRAAAGPVGNPLPAAAYRKPPKENGK